ncbi:MAG TPA: hypothetical protein PKX94_11065, partial [Opitutales bacterium]|nr:hypothetical protein [Opitutales bacterium]
MGDRTGGVTRLGSFERNFIGSRSGIRIFWLESYPAQPLMAPSVEGKKWSGRLDLNQRPLAP